MYMYVIYIWQRLINPVTVNSTARVTQGVAGRNETLPNVYIYIYAIYRHIVTCLDIACAH